MAIPVHDVKAHVALLHEMIAAKQKEEAKRSALWDAEVQELHRQIEHRNEVNLLQLRDLERMEDERSRRLEVMSSEMKKEQQAQEQLRKDVAAVIKLQHEQVSKLDQLMSGSLKTNPEAQKQTETLEQLLKLQQSQIQLLQQQRGNVPPELEATLRSLLSQQEAQLSHLSKINPTDLSQTSPTVLQKIVDMLGNSGSNTHQLLESLTHSTEDGVLTSKGLSNVESKIGPLKSQNRRIQEQLDVVMNERSILNSKLQTVEGALESCKTSLEETTRRLEEKNKQWHEAIAELKHAHASLETKDKEIGSLHHQLETAQINIHSTQTAQVSSSTEAEALRRRVETLQKEISRMKGVYSEDVAAIKAASDRLSTRCSTLEQQLRATQDEMKAEVLRHQHTQRKAQELQAQLSSQAESGMLLSECKMRLRAETEIAAEATTRCKLLEEQLQQLHEESARQRKEHQQTMIHCQYLMSLVRGDSRSGSNTGATPRRAHHTNVQALQDRMNLVASDAERLLLSADIGKRYQPSNPSPDPIVPQPIPLQGSTPQPTTTTPGSNPHQKLESQDLGSIHECLASGISRRLNRITEIEGLMEQTNAELVEVNDRERRLEDRRRVALEAIREQSQSVQRNISTWTLSSVQGDQATRKKYESMILNAQKELDSLRKQDEEINSKADGAKHQIISNRLRLQQRNDEYRLEKETLQSEMSALRERENVIQTVVKRMNPRT